MTRSAWLRLAFLVASIALVFGLIELALYAGWAVALGASLGGLCLATLLAEDWQERSAAVGEKPEEVRSGARQRRDLLREAGVRDSVLDE